MVALFPLIESKCKNYHVFVLGCLSVAFWGVRGASSGRVRTCSGRLRDVFEALPMRCAGIFGAFSDPCS